MRRRTDCGVFGPEHTCRVAFGEFYVRRRLSNAHCALEPTASTFQAPSLNRTSQCARESRVDLGWPQIHAHHVFFGHPIPPSWARCAVSEERVALRLVLWRSTSPQSQQKLVWQIHAVPKATMEDVQLLFGGDEYAAFAHWARLLLLGDLKTGGSHRCSCWLSL